MCVLTFPYRLNITSIHLFFCHLKASRVFCPFFSIKLYYSVRSYVQIDRFLLLYVLCSLLLFMMNNRFSLSQKNKHVIMHANKSCVLSFSFNLFFSCKDFLFAQKKRKDKLLDKNQIEICHKYPLFYDWHSRIVT